MELVIVAIVVVLVALGLVAIQVRRSVNKTTPEVGPGEETPRPGADADSEGEERADRGVDPVRPAKPEDRQLGDAGAETGPQPESERLADRPR